jgi:hypothetical protein
LRVIKERCKHLNKLQLDEMFIYFNNTTIEQGM